MKRDDARRLMRRHADAANRHDTAALLELYADDAVVESPMFDTVRGKEAIGRSFERLFRIFPDMVIDMDEDLSLTEGDRAAQFNTVTGTHSAEFFGLPPTGQQIQYKAARLLKLRDGVIVREQRVYDFRGVIERLEKSRLDQELSIASAVQHTLLRTRHEGEFFTAVGASLPCRAIGGDFIEYLNLPDGSVAIAVGDVAGKGPAAALVAAMLQGMFAIAAADDPSPSRTLARLNLALLRRGISPRFATLTYGTLAPDGTFRYSNAGHHPPVLLRAGQATLLTEGGPMLGIFDQASFPEGVTRLGPGDTLVAVSDGVTETEAPDGSDFGMDRLVRTAAAHRADTPATILADLLGSVEAFSGGAPPTDDVTIAVVKYRSRA